MAVSLSVSDVRREILRAAGGPWTGGDGRPSTALLGRLFHEMFETLFDSGIEVEAILRDTQPENRGRELLDIAYKRSIGPALLENQTALQSSAAEVASFWTAVREVCDWLAEIFAQVPPSTTADQRRRSSRPLGWIKTEAPLVAELKEPGWRDSVQLIGTADAILRPPGRNAWCVAEWKLGRTAPEADLAQACLYHYMLRALERDQESEAEPDGALAVVNFLPERKEQLFTTEQLEEAHRKLIELIGRLAGVAGEAKTGGATGDGKPAMPDPSTKSSPNWAHAASDEEAGLGARLLAAFREYNAKIEFDGPPVVGPTFMRFRVRLGHGISLGKVKSNAKNVMLRLGLSEPPTIGTADGRVVIDVQRPNRQFVQFDDVRDQLEPGDALLGCSKLAVGVNLDGKLEFADLADPINAHILVAGTTGSGKSEWLRSALASLLFTNTPETLRLVLIDPKRNSFHHVRESQFLMMPIVFPDEEPAAETLAELVEEMERRYALFDGADSLPAVIRRTGKPIPRIVCVCEEYYALISESKEVRIEIEQLIGRLGAKARAAGIHLIIATQQPSREVVKGTLDSNLPARVGLRMSSPIESRMLLHEDGAECLLGHGDLYFKNLGAPKRLQSPYIAPDRLEAMFSADPAARVCNPSLAASET